MDFHLRIEIHRLKNANITVIIFSKETISFSKKTKKQLQVEISRFVKTCDGHVRYPRHLFWMQQRIQAQNREQTSTSSIL